jgi:hypothetical protein
MQEDQQASAPQMDLDRDRQQRLSTSVLLTPQSVANLSPSSTTSSSPLPNAPLVTQKRASSRAKRSQIASHLKPITVPSPSSSNQLGSPIVSYSSSSDFHPHASSRRDPDLTADSLHKGLRPKSSYHQSLLNLRDELHKTSDSGVYHSRVSPAGFVSSADLPLLSPAATITS